MKTFQARTVMNPNQTLLRTLLHFKNIALDMERLNVVYHVPIVDCHADYLGQTKRKLGKRLDEHRRAVQKVKVEIFVWLNVFGNQTIE